MEVYFLAYFSIFITISDVPRKNVYSLIIKYILLSDPIDQSFVIQMLYILTPFFVS